MLQGYSRGVSSVRVLAGVAFAVILGGYTIYHANFVIGRSLLFAFPGWEVTYRSAWPLPGGGVIARDVRLVPADAEAGDSFQFATARIDVPFFEYYGSAFSRRRGSLLDSIRNLHMRFSGGHGDLSVPFTRELGLFGNVSAAPFEAEGCPHDNLWVESDLAAMGLASQGVELVLDYHRDNGHLIKQQSVNSPGLGRVELRRDIIEYDETSFFSLSERGRREVASDEWRVSDEGFVAARNRYCQGAAAADEFVHRHARAVGRLLETAGLVADPQLEQAYRRYAAHGGTLAVMVRYDPPIGSPLYAADDLRGWLPRMHGTLAVDGTATALALAPTTPRPLPQDADTLTTYEILQHEDAAVAAESPPPAPSAALPVATSVAAAAAPAARAVQAPGVAGLATPRPRAAALATPPPPPAAAALATPPPPPTAAPRAPLLITATVGSAAGGAVRVAADAGGTAERLTRYKDLANHLGSRMTVYQRGREPVRVQIVRVVETGNILVRRFIGAGSAEYVLDPLRFDHAEP